MLRCTIALQQRNPAMKTRSANPMAVPLPGLAAIKAWGRIAQGLTQMNLAAAEVIWQRSTMMALGAMSAPEAARMWLEKPTAFATAAEKAMTAAARGGDALAVTAAALRPYRRRTTANARRLRR
jgi:hypothetical protein